MRRQEKQTETIHPQRRQQHPAPPGIQFHRPLHLPVRPLLQKGFTAFSRSTQSLTFVNILERISGEEATAVQIAPKGQELPPPLPPSRTTHPTSFCLTAVFLPIALRHMRKHVSQLCTHFLHNFLNLLTSTAWLALAVCPTNTDTLGPKFGARSNQSVKM